MGQSSQKMIFTQSVKQIEKSFLCLEEDHGVKDQPLHDQKIKVEVVRQKQGKGKKGGQKKHENWLNNSKIKVVDVNLGENDEMCARIYENNRKYVNGRRNEKDVDMMIRHKSSNNSVHDKKSMHKSLHGNSCQQILLRQKDVKRLDDLKLQYYKNNKKRIEQSMEVCFCIQKVLNSLSNNEILKSDEFNKLNAKNCQVLERKQKRIRNLEMREKKIRVVGVDDKQNMDDNKSSVFPKIQRMEYFSQPKMLF